MGVKYYVDMGVDHEDDFHHDEDHHGHDVLLLHGGVHHGMDDHLEVVHQAFGQLVDEDEAVVFSDSIAENQTSLVLPASLTGTFELQIVTDQYIFYCEIELD